MTENMITWLVFSPLLGILLLLFVHRENERLIKAIGIVGTLIPLALSLMLLSFFDFNQEGYQLTHTVPWIQFTLPGTGQALEINYELGADGMSVAFLVLTTVISTLAAVASLYIKQRLKAYFILFFLLMTGMLGVFASMNLFLFFIFFELTIIPMFFLIGIWGYVERERAAYHFLLYNGIGSAVMLVAFVAMFMNLGTLHIPTLTEWLAKPFVPQGLAAGLFLALLFAFGVKLPVFPFHSWMLKVHVQAPPAIVMIHSGVLLKLGAYGLIRLNMGMLPAQMEQFAYLIALLGVVNILYGAVLAFRQRDLKLVLAYSSVSHMGIVLLGIGAMNYSGLQGAIFQSVSHGLISALLFFLIAAIYERTNTSMIPELGGLAKNMPVICGALLAAGLANLGLPGMSGFISEFLAFLGIFNTYPALAAVGVLGIILTAVYVLRAVLLTTFGPAKEQWAGLKDVRGFEYVPITVLLGLIILIGVYPSVLGETIHLSVETIVHGLLARIGG
ncbi:proton-translocating NADH-quinone oxidoreductase, chain M [Caldalkalibacillus thermarum TA2.A1]|uniref:NADH-quinone oxidoreductase subunit M n=1 Tax=Caldalkalibacillus thermarum (strain TA2.A1) TaxID=986075 RepID=F5LA60_CALTT|nr:NADH-quinone oxidoreductase subunit M [Caldalkalibacillus thermarum]EGL81780.1 proton-translocating NADH-quinone oxidoreductase, chain M [Caldalkalibacillus thermarum TA2.A1]QZT34155.1 NADH-quinone oxidoreductase subunit M [Caldalkalibacillus thermarum TA2.A1]